MTNTVRFPTTRVWSPGVDRRTQTPVIIWSSMVITQNQILSGPLLDHEVISTSNFHGDGHITPGRRFQTVVLDDLNTHEGMLRYTVVSPVQ